MFNFGISLFNTTRTRLTHYLFISDISNASVKMRSLKLLLLVLTLFAQHGHITGYSSGAPDSKCGSMLPAHGQTPKDNANSPYTVEVSEAETMNTIDH